jgi:hypothetical protein
MPAIVPVANSKQAEPGPEDTGPDVAKQPGQTPVVTPPDATLRLGYLGVLHPDPHTWLAGLLVTDARGLPQAFQHTEPVRPTRLQQVLFGPTLADAVLAQSVVPGLLRRMSQALPYVLVQEDTLLSVPPEETRLIRLSATNVAGLGAPGAVEYHADLEVLFQACREPAPLRLTWTPASLTGAGIITSRISGSAPTWTQTDWTTCCRQLTSASLLMDLLEPFQRVTQALDMLWQESATSTASRPSG